MKSVRLLGVAMMLGSIVTVWPRDNANGAVSSLPPRPISWLAAGDSYSSGEGLPHNDGSQCQRATGVPPATSEAYSEVAAPLARSEGYQFSNGSPDMVACSGATTSDLFPDQVPSLSRWDLITFTFGGDDVHFSSVIEQCLHLDSSVVDALNWLEPVASWLDDAIPGCPSNSSLRASVAAFAPVYRSFLLSVANHAVTPGGNIVVLGYPELIEAPKFWPTFNQALGLCEGVTEGEANELRGLAGDLNATIGEAVAQIDEEPATKRNAVHVTFLDVNTGQPSSPSQISDGDPNLFEPNVGPRHNLCAAKEWLNGITHIDHGLGSFHPNQEGQDAEGHLLAEVLRHLEWSQLGAPVQWSSPVTVDLTGQGLENVSCVSTSFCLASDSGGNVFTWDGTSWSGPTAVDTDGSPFVAACATSSFCYGGDEDGSFYTWQGGSWSGELVDPQTAGLVSIGCVNTALCWIADAEGNAYLWNGTSWSSPMPVEPSLDGSGRLEMGCPSTTFCVAVDPNGNAFTWDGSSWTSTSSVNLSGSEVVDFECTSMNFCMVLDSSGNTYTWNGSLWSGPTLVSTAGHAVNSLTCLSSSFCMSVDTGGSVSSWTASSWSTPATIDSGAELTSVDCVSTTFCVAVDSSGDALTYESQA